MKTRIRGFLGLALLAIAASLLSVAGAIAAPVFGNHGRVLTSFPGGDAKASAVAADQQGRLVAVGGASNGANEDIALARYLRDGTLDPSFLGGRVLTNLGADEQARDVAIDSAGRVVVAGNRRVENHDEAFVVRYLSDGRPDLGFGSGGVAPIGPGHAFSLAIDPAGRVVVAGDGPEAASEEGYGPPWRIVRLTPSGGPDTSFGGGDAVVVGGLPIPFGISSVALDVALDAQGRIVFTGCGEGEIGEGPESEGGSEPLLVARLEPTGSPDTSFGEGGVRAIPIHDGETCGRTIAVDGLNRIVAVGEGEYGWHVARLLPNGRLDRTFSNDGRSGVFLHKMAEVGQVAIDGRNRVLLAGGLSTVSAGPESDVSSRVAVARLTAGGGADNRFAPHGVAAVGFGPGKSLKAHANALAIVGNTVYTAGFAVARFNRSQPGRFALAGLSLLHRKR